MPTHRFDEVRAIIDSGPLTADVISRLAADLRNEYIETQSLSAFVSWCVFRTLSSTFDDPQAVKSSEIDSYNAQLLPRLRDWLASPESFNSPEQMGLVVQALARCELQGGQPG
ncbi:MAG: hypothetical protein WD847_02510 [Pirellulales bacterium]